MLGQVLKTFTQGIIYDDQFNRFNRKRQDKYGYVHMSIDNSFDYFRFLRK